MYTVELTGKSKKQFDKLESNIRFHYTILFKKLEANPFMGKLSDTVYHVHIKYHWVAVWEVDKSTNLVKVTYVGSREKAPY